MNKRLKSVRVMSIGERCPSAPSRRRADAKAISSTEPAPGPASSLRHSETIWLRSLSKLKKIGEKTARFLLLGLFVLVVFRVLLGLLRLL